MSTSGSARESAYTPKFAGLDDLGSSLITLTVRVDIFRANLRSILSYVAPSRMICVVKANAYGYGIAGLIPVFNEFQDVALGVATPDEALELLACGYSGRIILLGYTHPKCFYEIVTSGCELAAYRPEHLPLLAEAAAQRGAPLRLHIKVESGLTRLGLMVDELAPFLRELNRYPQLEVVGLFSHFADSGHPDAPINEVQIERFRRAIEIAETELGYRPECHLANSAAVLNFPDLRLDSVRVGILAYGVRPATGDPATLPDLAPCFTLASEVIDLHRIRAGEGVSYGHSFVADRDTVVATFPYGYADGMPRNISNNRDVLIGGRRCPQIGTVTMDYSMADVTGLVGDGTEVRIGDPVVLIGTQGNESVRIEEVAKRAGTISYELSCRWGKRVIRAYVDR